MRIISLVVLVALTLLLTGLRLDLLGSTPPVADPGAAARWADCFGARAQIADKQSVTLMPLPTGGGATSRLLFEALDQVEADVPREADLIRQPDGTRATLKVGARLADMKGRLRLTLRDARDGSDGSRSGAGMLLQDDRGVWLLDRGPAAFQLNDVTLPAVDRVIVPVADPNDAPPEVTLMQGGRSGARRIGLPKGTTGVVAFDAPLGADTAQLLRVKPWLLGSGPQIQPIRAFALKGIDQVAIEARRPSLRLDVPGTTMLACVAAGTGKVGQAGIAEVKAPSAGGGTVSVFVPQGLVGVASLYDRVGVGLFEPESGFTALGGYTSFNQGVAFVAASGLSVALFGWLLTLRHAQIIRLHRSVTSRDLPFDGVRWVSSLFIPPGDQDPSLSLFQIFLWTVITVWGLVYVFIVTGSLLSLTTQFLALLGIAGSGSLLARWVAATRGGEIAGGPGASEAPHLDDFQFWQILSTDGRFDLLKLQTLVFTLVIAVYVISRIIVAGAFPELDQNTLLLLGVSQGIYVGGKLAGSTALARAQTLKLDLDVRQGQVAALNDDKDDLATRAQAGQQLSPADASRLAALPALITAKQAEIERLKPTLEEAVKTLKLPTA